MASTGPSAAPWQQWLDWWLIQSPAQSHGPGQEHRPQRTRLRPLITKLLGLIAADKTLLITASVFMVAAAVAELSVPHFVTSCIFAAAAPGATSTAVQPTLRVLTAIIIVYGITSALRGYCFSLLNNRMTMRLRTRLFGNLVRQPVAFFDANETGSLTSRLQADCQAMTKCIATNLNIAARNVLQALGGILYLAWTSPVMCGATLAVCATLWAITLLYGEYARRTQKVFQDTLACSNQVAEEVLSLTRVVRTFGTEGAEQARYSGWLARLYQVGLRQASGYGVFLSTSHITCYMTKVVALSLGCAAVCSGSMTAEALTSFLAYVEFTTYASLSACDEVVEVLEAVGASERVMDLLDKAPAAQVAAGVVLPAFTGDVQLRDVSFTYPTRPDAIALSHVNLHFAPGSLTALVGLSGSGKTTLVALLQRLYDPSGGAVMMDGCDLRELDASWFRSQLGVVNQEPKLFGTSVADNIAYGCPHATRDDIVAAAREANAHGFVSALPDGYDTRVTDKLLSGGQKQRIALARALVRKPRLLVLDEATSALDAESEALVQSALDSAMLARSRTVVVIAHRLSTVRKADTIVVMDKGQVVEMGSHEQLVRQQGLYHGLVARQQGIASSDSFVAPSVAVGSHTQTPLQHATSILSHNGATISASHNGSCRNGSHSNGTSGASSSNGQLLWHSNGSAHQDDAGDVSTRCWGEMATPESSPGPALRASADVQGGVQGLTWPSEATPTPHLQPHQPCRQHDAGALLEVAQVQPDLEPAAHSRVAHHQPGGLPNWQPTALAAREAAGGGPAVSTKIAGVGASAACGWVGDRVYDPALVEAAAAAVTAENDLVSKLGGSHDGIDHSSST